MYKKSDYVMNLDEYKEKLIEYAALLNQIPTDPARFGYANFEKNVYRLLDENYEIYINAPADERNKIRQIVKDYDRDEKHIYEGGPISAPFRYILNFYGSRAIKQMEETGDAVWVWRGLAAISILDGIHYRSDDEEHLARLYVAAEEKGIDPNPIFQLISEISNTEPTKLGEISISELIGNIPNTANAIVDGFRKMFLVDKENE
jgi:hypothetical protein